MFRCAAMTSGGMPSDTALTSLSRENRASVSSTSSAPR
jgi:hypothetical protein